jgi:hypothetical protein
MTDSVMSNDIPQAVQDSVDISQISQLILTERESRDLGEWESLLDCYHPDSIVCISWINASGPEFVKGSMDMAKRGVLAKHRLAPIRVSLHGDRALASVIGIIDIPTVIEGVELILSAYGRFLYRVEKREGKWRIYSFECVYHRDEFIPVVLGQTVNIDPEELKVFRPSYRNLSYSLSKTGYKVNAELAGEDRPDIVAKLLQEINAWLKND